MKRAFLQTCCLVLVLTFSAVGSLSIACAYHHGIDGLDHSQQTPSHRTLFCSSLSKVSGQVLIPSVMLDLTGCEASSIYLAKSHDKFVLLLAQNYLARSPPIFQS